MSIITITVPDLSGSTDVDVVEVLVKDGDSINEGDSLIVLETDKASMEVPSTHSGVVVSMKIKVDDQVNEGDLLLELDTGAAAAAAPVAEEAPAAEPAPAASAPAAAPEATATAIEAVLIPDLSGATDVDVVEVLVKDGDTVAEGDSLIVLETDKASMEVPAPKAGVVISMKITEGSTVNEGDLLMDLQVGAAEAPAAAPAAASEPAPAAACACGGCGW